MQFVLLEDDSSQSDWLMDDLRAHTPKATIRLVTSEYEFRGAIDSFRKSQPDLFILDVMVRWTKPGPHLVQQPGDVHTNGYFRAGIRCAELLREEGFGTPIILYTILEDDDLAEDLERLRILDVGNVIYVRKESTSDELLSQIRSKIKTLI